VWVSEHHFLDDAYMPSLLPVCAAIGARTSRIRIGTGVLLAPLYEPVRLAEDVATLDLLTRGRFILGLGLGWREEEFEALRVPQNTRARRMLDTVETLRQAWQGRPVTGGSLITYPNVFVTPQPFTPGGPPIWIGGSSEPAIRRSGRIADGFMASGGSPKAFGRQVALAREEAARAGRDPDTFTFSMHVPTFTWSDGDPWELIRAHHHYISWKYEDMADARSRPIGDPPPPPDLTPDQGEKLRKRIVMGTPEQVANQVDAYREAAGGDVHWIARSYFPGLPWDIQLETMRLFAQEVLPQLR